MDNFLVATFIKKFNEYKKLADNAIAQLEESQLHLQPNKESNSVAVIVQHMYGNMLSRWTDFLTTDGEKDWRQRDQEFEAQKISRETLLANWEKGWECLFHALTNLKDNQLQEIVFIRKEPLTVADAMIRQVAHYGYHVGQIVYLSKWLKNEDWTNLSMPKNEKHIKKS